MGPYAGGLVTIAAEKKIISIEDKLFLRFSCNGVFYLT